MPPLISAVVTAEFRVYAFDTAAVAVTAAATSGERPIPGDWERAFACVKADGSTSIGAPLANLRRERIVVEQILLVTDEQENTAPLPRRPAAF